VASSATRRHPRPWARTDIVVATLAASAGAVDAVSFLGLHHVFTANMTGNIVLLGIALGLDRPVGALRATLALAGYVAGGLIAHGLLAHGAVLGGRAEYSAVARALHRAANPFRAPRGLLSLVLALQVVFTVGWLASGGRPVGVGEELLTAVLGVAMGVQGVAVGASDLAGISTTYLTGMLTKTLGELIDPSRRDAWTVRKIGAIVALTAGAAAATALYRYAILLPPFLALALIVVGTAASPHRSPLGSTSAPSPGGPPPRPGPR
jgi:uncharacterized membrane protein YoaK (UPF0700 family)